MKTLKVSLFILCSVGLLDEAWGWFVTHSAYTAFGVLFLAFALCWDTWEHSNFRNQRGK